MTPDQQFIITLVILSFLDYVTGVMVAIVKKKLSSYLSFKGIFRKVCMFFIVCACYLMGEYLMAEAKPLYGLVCVFYCSTEVISILENANKLKLPLPEKLKSFLQSNADKK